MNSYYNGNNCIDGNTGFVIGSSTAGAQLSYNVNGAFQAKTVPQLPQQQTYVSSGSLSTPLNFATNVGISAGNSGAPLSFVTQQPAAQTNQQLTFPQTTFPTGALPLGQYLPDGTNVGVSTTTTQTPLVFTQN